MEVNQLFRVKNPNHIFSCDCGAKLYLKDIPSCKTHAENCQYFSTKFSTLIFSIKDLFGSYEHEKAKLILKLILRMVTEKPEAVEPLPSDYNPFNRRSKNGEMERQNGLNHGHQHGNDDHQHQKHGHQHQKHGHQHQKHGHQHQKHEHRDQNHGHSHGAQIRKDIVFGQKDGPDYDFKGNLVLNNLRRQENVSDQLQFSLKCDVCYSEKNAAKFKQFQCGHLACNTCFDSSELIETDLNDRENPVCLVKGCRFSVQTKKSQLEFQKMVDGSDLARCAFCPTTFLFEPGNPSEAPDRDNNGKPLSLFYKNLYAKSRFKCPNTKCRKEQCKDCGASPYHVGMTCEEYKNLVQCRYCLTPIEHEIDYQLNPFSDICTIEPKCMEKVGNACTEILPCGHRCGGIKGERHHPVCMFDECVKKRGDEPIQCVYCQENLNTAPFIKLGCGHYVHYHCVLECMKVAWSTKRMTFQFLNCPTCKKPLNLTGNTEASKLYKQHFKLRAKVLKLSLDRLRIEMAEHRVHLNNPQHRFYNDQDSYALAVYAVYPCNKSSQPFVGGRVNCEREANVDIAAEKEKFICFDCANIKRCPIHGSRYMMYKCRYCCKVATWFCFGTTHFCDECHRRLDGRYKRCDGKGDCELGLMHPPNPCEFPLGCAACKFK